MNEVVKGRKDSQLSAEPLSDHGSPVTVFIRASPQELEQQQSSPHNTSLPTTPSCISPPTSFAMDIDKLFKVGTEKHGGPPKLITTGAPTPRRKQAEAAR